MLIKINFEDENKLEIASGIAINIPDNITSFKARRVILQEVVHALDHYILRELVEHLESVEVIRDSGW